MDEKFLKLAEKVPYINLEKAIGYCGGSEEFYEEMLGEFCECKNIESAETAYASEDWKTYTISVHSLKGLARTLGMVDLGDMAEGLQKASEQANLRFVHEHHELFMDEVHYVVECIRECIM